LERLMGLTNRLYEERSALHADLDAAAGPEEATRSLRAFMQRLRQDAGTSPGPLPIRELRQGLVDVVSRVIQSIPDAWTRSCSGEGGVQADLRTELRPYVLTAGVTVVLTIGAILGRLSAQGNLRALEVIALLGLVAVVFATRTPTWAAIANAGVGRRFVDLIMPGTVSPSGSPSTVRPRFGWTISPAEEGLRAADSLIANVEQNFLEQGSTSDPTPDSSLAFFQDLAEAGTLNDADYAMRIVLKRLPSVLADLQITSLDFEPGREALFTVETVPRPSAEILGPHRTLRPALLSGDNCRLRGYVEKYE